MVFVEDLLHRSCGVCDGDGTSCLVNVTFSVDMSIEGVVEGNN